MTTWDLLTPLPDYFTSFFNIDFGFALLCSPKITLQFDEPVLSLKILLRLPAHRPALTPKVGKTDICFKKECFLYCGIDVLSCDALSAMVNK